MTWSPAPRFLVYYYVKTFQHAFKSGHVLAIDADNSKGDSPTRTPSAGETVVKLREGDGPPLIILHGEAGTINTFSPLKKSFSSALWAIQVTTGTPLHTLHAQCRFYFDKIKVEQPTGPYRICGFSGSSILAVALVQLFENNGDIVVQLSFIDHFPTIFLAPGLGVDIFKTPLCHPTARQEMIAVNVENLFALTYRDGRENLPQRHKLANELRMAYNDRPSSATADSIRIAYNRFLNQIFDFLLKLKDDAQARGQDGQEMGFLEDWLKLVKAPVTAYLAMNGLLGCLVLENHRSEEWYDLGIHRCFPNAKVEILDAGHFDILKNHSLIRGLQDDYILSRARL
ncbi:hypothetical protein GALMADRAFT_145946 [Galerina marginata CBS 339.88]|uniref:Thioesterase domain-containing protein n=1 Tax=Galerina marginata (strain CBS 339.88) TaxID=685588 RepID=A0A067SDF0_GALM3|nr:hypothetical protein GALMADRAFT_145946 [Galerina marginata CBS 339.88]